MISVFGVSDAVLVGVLGNVVRGPGLVSELELVPGAAAIEDRPISSFVGFGDMVAMGKCSKCEGDSVSSIA